MKVRPICLFASEKSTGKTGQIFMKFDVLILAEILQEKKFA